MIVVSFISLNVELIILSRESICKTRDFIFSWFCLKKVSLRVLSIQKNAKLIRKEVPRRSKTTPIFIDLSVITKN